MSLLIAEERKVTIFLASLNFLDSSEAFGRIIYPNGLKKVRYLVQMPHDIYKLLDCLPRIIRYLLG